MIRIWPEQTAKLREALSADPVDLTEAYLRKHYPEDCDMYDRAALRAWIEEALRVVGRRGERSASEVLFDVSTRWVLRDWLGGGPAR